MECDRPPVSFARALRVAGYNWPLYLAAGFVFVLGGLTAYCPGLPTGVRWSAAFAAGVALWFACASFWAFHAMFDRSELLGGRWLKEEMSPSPYRWVHINAGLEETTLPLGQIFPDGEGKWLDLFDPTVMTEPTIIRAREQERQASSIASNADALPVEAGWADLVVVMLAAHEIRDQAMRERFFHELRRIASPEGRIVVVEHLRDLPAALAFGPGLLHFYPHSEWLRLGKLAGLEVARERRITSFVRVFFYRRAALSS